MKRLMGYTAVILATLVVLQILWQFKLVLLLFLLSLFLAAAVRPIVEKLTARGVPRAVAQLLLYAAGIGGIVLLFFLVGNLLVRDLNDVANRMVLDYEAFHRQWQAGASWQQTAVTYLPTPLSPVESGENELAQMLPGMMIVTQSAAGAVAGLILVSALSVYWSVDQYRFERLWLSLLPAQRRAYARDSWRGIETAVGSYLRSQSVQSVLAGLILAVSAALIGFEFPLLLGFVGALAAFVPLFGGLLAALFAFVVGSWTSVTLGVVTAVFTVLLFLALELFVEPHLWTRGRRSFLLTILVLVPLTDAFGLWGLLAAPLLSAALSVIIKQAYQAHINNQDRTMQLADIKAKYLELKHKATTEENGEISPELQSLLHRLSDLLEEYTHYAV